MGVSGLATSSAVHYAAAPGVLDPLLGAVLFFGGSSSVPGIQHPVPCPSCTGMKSKYARTCVPCFHASRVRPAEERFWEKVEWSEGCWLWQGATAKGYGRFATIARRSPSAAHRVAYELAVGPIPDGMQIDHLCRTPRCVNPAHLEPVTVRLNTLRGFSPSSDRARRTHCPRGHEYTPENTILSRQNQRKCRACHPGKPRPPKIVVVKPPRLRVVKPVRVPHPYSVEERKKRTHCPSGHEYTAENTRLSGRNQRNCRACDRRWAQERRDRKRAA
jgi:hypothetical protein